jgi:uncharacterized SAM-binding protein YcdF (DUF218 family)
MPELLGWWSAQGMAPRQLDAVLIPGGGLTDAGELPPYVVARLDRALAHPAAYFIPLSAGTPHRPPPLDARGYPICEAWPAARYLRAHGIPERRILAETFSYDTIGNAFFTRLVHAEPRGLRRLHVVTSEFHMPRTEAIFRWVFGVTPSGGYELSFEAAENAGISGEALEHRAAKERASLDQAIALSRRIVTLSELHEWMYAEHGAYAWFRRENAYRPVAGPLAETYGNSG